MNRRIYAVEQVFNYYTVYYTEENRHKKHYLTSIYGDRASYNDEYFYAKGYKRIESAARVAEKLQRKATIKYRLERCRDCICLVAGDNGEWICDECERLCNEIGDVECPELDKYEREICRANECDFAKE